MDVFGKNEIKNEKFDLVNATENDLALYNIKKGDVLFIRSSVKREGVGETVLVKENMINTVFSGFLIRFRESSVYLSLLFKKYCFSTIPFRTKLLSCATTSANTNINQESLSSIRLNFPSIPEQQKISKFLSQIDDKISRNEKQITHIQNFKKGLLQQMFV